MRYATVINKEKEESLREGRRHQTVR